MLNMMYVCCSLSSLCCSVGSSHALTLLLHSRVVMPLQSTTECPFDLRETVCTLIWTGQRAEIPEFRQIQQQFLKK